MAENKEKNDKSDDVIAREDYNKVVEAHNSAKVELEKLQKELKTIKDSDVNNKVNAEKNEWKQLGEGLKQEIEDLKKQVQQKQDETKVAKGIVPGQSNMNQSHTKNLSREEIKAQLDEGIPTDQIKNVSNLSPIQRYGYYKSPTRAYSNQVFGRALSLDAGRFASKQVEISNYARPTENDIVVHVGKKTLG